MPHQLPSSALLTVPTSGGSNGLCAHGRPAGLRRALLGLKIYLSDGVYGSLNPALTDNVRPLPHLLFLGGRDIPRLLAPPQLGPPLPGSRSALVPVNDTSSAESTLAAAAPEPPGPPVPHSSHVPGAAPVDKRRLHHHHTCRHLSSRPRWVPCTLYGPTCDSLDTLNERVMLPADLTVGEWMYFRNFGAYSSALTTTFNGFPAARSFYVFKMPPLYISLRHGLTGKVAAPSTSAVPLSHLTIRSPVSGSPSTPFSSPLQWKWLPFSSRPHSATSSARDSGRETATTATTAIRGDDTPTKPLSPAATASGSDEPKVAKVGSSSDSADSDSSSDDASNGLWTIAQQQATPLTEPSPTASGLCNADPKYILRVPRSSRLHTGGAPDAFTARGRGARMTAYQNGLERRGSADGVADINSVSGHTLSSASLSSAALAVLAGDHDGSARSSGEWKSNGSDQKVAAPTH